MAFEDDRFLTARSTDDTIGADYDRVIQSLERAIYTFLGAPVGAAFTPPFAIDQDGNVQIKEELSFLASDDIPVTEIVDEITEDNDTALATVTAIRDFVTSGSMSFLELTDVVPDSYSGADGKYVVVDVDELVFEMPTLVSLADIDGYPDSNLYLRYNTGTSKAVWDKPDFIADVDGTPADWGSAGQYLRRSAAWGMLEWTSPSEGVSEHGLLSDVIAQTVDPDDHPEYLMTDGSRQVDEGERLIQNEGPTQDYHLANKGYVDERTSICAYFEGSLSIAGDNNYYTLPIQSLEGQGHSGAFAVSGNGIKCNYAPGYFMVSARATFPLVTAPAGDGTRRLRNSKHTDYESIDRVEKTTSGNFPITTLENTTLVWLASIVDVVTFQVRQASQQNNTIELKVAIWQVS